jgi:hypothetical protein
MRNIHPSIRVECCRTGANIFATYEKTSRAKSFSVHIPRSRDSTFDLAVNENDDEEVSQLKIESKLFF